jgi:hypothetical protein
MEAVDEVLLLPLAEGEAAGQVAANLTNARGGRGGDAARQLAFNTTGLGSSCTHITPAHANTHV